LTVESNETQCILRLDGDCTMTSAAQLKAALVEGLAAATKEAKELCVDFGDAGEIDITALQLLWAAQRACLLDNRRFMSCAKEAARSLAREAGFAGLFLEDMEVPEG
jgi:anti-anti-sigma regulatory factor